MWISRKKVLKLLLFCMLSLPPFPFILAQEAGCTESKALGAAAKGSSPSSSRAAIQIQINAKAIDEVFSETKSWGPGAFVTISKNGNVLFQKGYGVEALKSKVPLNNSTVFDLASCSKQFTAAAILLLVERGLLCIDDEVSKYLPELKKEHQGYKGPNKLLLRHLMCMSSGLSDYSASWDTEQFSNKRLPAVAHWTADHKRKFAPGAKYEYNNGNYALLALIVERVTKQNFAEFMKQEFFLPLGMNSSLIMVAPGQDIRHRAGGYKESSLGFDWARQDTHIYGDGQLMTTPDDFALWDKSLYDCKLLKKTSLDLAFTNYPLSNGKLSGYGFGWEISNIKGHKIVSHSGSWDGTSTFILRCPDTGLSVMVLSNDEDFAASDAGEEIANSLLKKGN